MFIEKWIRKKKGLTDPVEIIPFPNQQLKNAEVKPTVTKPVVNTSPLFQKPQAKVLSVPTGKLNSANYSIKQGLEVKNEVENTISGLQKAQSVEPFTHDQLKIYWRQFAHDSKAKALETLYNAMIKRDPILLDDYQVKMEVDNQVQVDYINAHINELIDFLRGHLKNYKIMVSTFISDNQVEEVRNLNGKDRFMSMAKKNANLHTFKKVFNLDIEY